MDGGWLGAVVVGAWAWVLKTQTAAHKQITLVKRLIMLKQIGDWSSYKPFQLSEKETDPGQPRLTQPSLSLGSCKRKMRRWSDPGPCPTRGRVKRPLVQLLHSSQSSMTCPLWHFHGNTMGSRPSPFKEENQSFPPSRSVIWSCCSFNGCEWIWTLHSTSRRKCVKLCSNKNNAFFILGR